MRGKGQGAAGAGRNLVPYFILEQFAKGQADGRFQAATLFMDISGFTATTNLFMQQSIMGGEAMADVMQSIFDPLVEAVYGYGGFITGFAGDAFTAVFPQVDANPADFAFIPAAWRGDPPQLRALAAGLAMQRQMQRQPDWETAWGTFRFAIKIGLAYGLVEWGIIGEPTAPQLRHLEQVDHAYFFRGPAIDECSFSEQVSGRNDLVMADSLVEQLGEQVSVKKVEEGFWSVTAVHRPLPDPQPSYLISPNPDLLAFFVPQTILHQQVRGEYRHVFTLFLQLQAIQTNQQLNEFVQLVFVLQKQYGGYLNTVHFGDKGCTLLLFWGMPTSHENDAERVLNFVLRLRQETAVPFRAGISYRMMYAGFVGSSTQRQEYSCYGRGVNLASRLMSAAPWGAIWLDENVARRALARFILSQQGRFLLKGFGEPQLVYTLRGQRTPTHPLYPGRMVARQRELAQLAAWIRPLVDGRAPGIAQVYGEAGIGKSRLITEFRHQILHASPQQATIWQWFSCQTDEILRQSLNPFRQLLREYFQQEINNTPQENLLNFTNKMNDLLAHMSADVQQEELRQLQPYLQALLDLPVYDPAYSLISPDSRFPNTLLALKLLLVAESQRQPLILHIEDVHWLDADSWRFINQLTNVAHHQPIALILTGRTHQIPEATQIPDAVTLSVELGPLSHAALAELGARVMGQVPAPKLVELLAQRSDGNPFFAEQILLYLAEQGVLHEVNTEDPRVQLVPVDVRAVLVARLDSLSQEVREVVQQASVLGREFDVQLLAHMLRTHQNLFSHILDAERASIWTAVSQLRYLFKHALLRDAAYDMQLRARRQELHKVAAEALEKVYASDLSRHYAELVYHYGQAKMWRKEGYYAQLAGIQAAEQYANAEAEQFLARALDLIPTGDVATRYNLLLHQENVHNIQGKRDAQQADLDALFALMPFLHDEEKTAVVYSRQARFANFISNYPLAAEAAESCVKRSSNEQTVAEGYLHWGRAFWRQGKYFKAQKLISEAWRRYKALDNREGLANALNEAGIIAQYLGQHSESRVCYEQALTIFRQTGNRLRLPTVLTNFGNLHYSTGRYSQAIALYEQAIALWEQQGYQQGLSISFLNMGVALRDLGDFTQAREYLERALPMSQQVQERTLESAVLVNLTLLFHQMGDQETAVTVGRRAVPMLAAVKAPHFEASAHNWLAHALTELTLYDEAERHYQQAITIRRETGQEKMVLESYAGLARIALGREDKAAIAQFGEAIWQAAQNDPELPGIHEQVRVYLTGFRSLQAVGDGRARRLLVQGHDLLQKLAAFLEDDRQRQAFLSEIPAHRELIAAWRAGQN